MSFAIILEAEAGGSKPPKENSADRTGRVNREAKAQVEQRSLRQRQMRLANGRTLGSLWGGPESGMLGAGL